MKSCYLWYPWSFPASDWSDDINCNLKFEGKIVDMICDIDPKYEETLLTIKKAVKRKLFAKLTKAVYCTLFGVI